MDLSECRDLILNHLPVGAAWPREHSSNLYRLVEALAKSVCHTHDRIDELLREAWPLTGAQLLGDWEVAYGLPGSCEQLGSDIETRRRDVAGKLSAHGAQTPAYFIWLLERMGITGVEIWEYPETKRLLNNPHRFLWAIRGPFAAIATKKYFRASREAAGDRLVWYEGLETLVCLLEIFKPAHTEFRLLFTDVPGFVVPPSGPRNIQLASAIPGTVSVNFIVDQNGGGAITMYELRYKKTTDTDWLSSEHSPPTPFDVTGLTSGANYFMRFRTRNSSGYSLWSDIENILVA